MSITSSFIRSHASSARSSLFRRRADDALLPAGPELPSTELPLPLLPAARNDGTPSTVVTIRLSVFPRLSNSWAEILRAGVLAPEPGRDPGRVAAAPVAESGDVVQDCAGVVVDAADVVQSCTGMMFDAADASSAKPRVLAAADVVQDCAGVVVNAGTPLPSRYSSTTGAGQRAT